MKLNRGPCVSYITVIATIVVILAIVLIFCLVGKSSDENEKKYSSNTFWTYQCIEGFCVRNLITNETDEEVLSMSSCHLKCTDGAALWPKPTGTVSISKELIKINVDQINIDVPANTDPANDLLKRMAKLFVEKILDKIPRNSVLKGGSSLFLKFNISDTSTSRLKLETSESYNLIFQESANGIEGTINSETVFGARHALETLNQLIVFCVFRNEVLMPKQGLVYDKPAYPYRGILIDTARSYVKLETIKRTLDGMAASKLNTLHWHITDSQSFPFVSKSRPKLSKLGAYSPAMVYTASDIKEILEYGLLRGVRILPEFDAPAHVGEGWQETGFVTCFKWHPWINYCNEPPCGQLDPTIDELYPFLEGIYADMIELFQPDIFHMGGDEVNFNCWNSTTGIVDWLKNHSMGRQDRDFVTLWEHFQNKAVDLVYKKAGEKIPIIMWTSTLTQGTSVLDILPKDNYIIQVWSKVGDSHTSDLLDFGYKVILSNYDALYLDCGFGSWFNDGNNWCSPYTGWQIIYEHTPRKIAGIKKNQVLGNEAALWSEQADSNTFDSRLWPRAAAMAEAVWSEPTTGWRQAEGRFLVHRERLINLGIRADAIAPTWCLQHEDYCRFGGKFN